MAAAELFSILDIIDSTNNYAMTKVQDGVARHGQTWYARLQFEGRGQRGKQWKSIPDENILMTIALQPSEQFHNRQFLLSVSIAIIIREFVTEKSNLSAYIKWPNDIYLNNKKVCGILIENKWQGKSWSWAIAGIGLNVNQEFFEEDLSKATSINIETGKQFDVPKLAKELSETIVRELPLFEQMNEEDLMQRYNQYLFKLGEKISVQLNDEILEGTVDKVSSDGFLFLKEYPEKPFKHGEAKWIVE